MARDQERREIIRGTEFALRPWSLEDGRSWSFRLAQILMSGGGDGGGVAAMLAAISPNDWRELCDVCIKYTQVVEVVDGEELLPKLADRKEQVLRGNLIVLALLVRLHVEVEFADFFGGLEEVFALPQAQKAPPGDAG